nr:unnamed protein product [Callosobruchus analis]
MNDQILGLLDGDYTTYLLSDDSVEIEDDGERLNLTIEFLKALINPSRMPQQEGIMRRNQISHQQHAEVKRKKVFSEKDKASEDHPRKKLKHNLSASKGFTDSVNNVACVVACAENITALRNGLDVALVLLGGTKSLPNILGLANLYAIFVENTCVLFESRVRKGRFMAAKLHRPSCNKLTTAHAGLLYFPLSEVLIFKCSEGFIIMSKL